MEVMMDEETIGKDVKVSVDGGMTWHSIHTGFSPEDLKSLSAWQNATNEYNAATQHARDAIQEFKITIDYGLEPHKRHLLERELARLRRLERAKSWWDWQYNALDK
jgi:nitrogen regulatory protein PII-like uncharacterized protein